MCVVSMVGDYYGDKWHKDYPWIVPQPYVTPTDQFTKPIFNPPPSREEFERLRKEVEDLKGLLERAKEYDKKNNEPDCEIEDKMKFLKEVAKLVGVDLDEVLKKDA